MVSITNSVISGPVAVEGGRRQRRREETSEKLFLAAMKLFSSKGFAQTKVEDITQVADVGKGTFFNYFPSKEHVLGYLVSRQLGTVQRHLILAREATMSSEEVLASLGRSLVQLPGKSPQMARSIILAILGNIEVRTYLVRELTKGRKSIAEIIHLGQERCELLDEIPPLALARAFQHALFGTVLMWALDPKSSLEKQFTDTMRMIFSGLSLSSKAPLPLRRNLPLNAAKRESLHTAKRERKPR
jgi:AcrR family transcriptional regulator